MAMFYDDVNYDVFHNSVSEVELLAADLKSADEKNKSLMEKLEFILANSEEARALANAWDTSIKIQKGG